MKGGQIGCLLVLKICWQYKRQGIQMFSGSCKSIFYFVQEVRFGNVESASHLVNDWIV